MTKYILFLLSLTSIQFFGQSETLKGKIIADSIHGYAINIVNYTKEIGTTNDENGFFEMPASAGDSIVFSSVQYQVRSIVVTSEQIEKQSINIVLYPVVQLLEQVKVSNIELSGNLDKDVDAVELQPFVDNETLGLPFSDKPQPTQIQRKIYTAKSGILDRPINYLNGTLKKLKKIKALEDLQQIVQKGTTTFSMTFFVEELTIPKELITDFMYYCAKDDNFNNLLENSKRLTLLEFFQEKAKSYKKHRELD